MTRNDPHASDESKNHVSADEIGDESIADFERFHGKKDIDEALRAKRKSVERISSSEQNEQIV